jgi:hypothetical protein
VSSSMDANPGEIVRVIVIGTKGVGWYQFFIKRAYDVIIPKTYEPHKNDRFMVADTPYNRIAFKEVLVRLGYHTMEQMLGCWIERQDLQITIQSNKQAKHFLRR